MSQRKETKKNIKVRDLQPRRDAKGGVFRQRPGQQGPRPQRPGRGDS